MLLRRWPVAMIATLLLIAMARPAVAQSVTQVVTGNEQLQAITDDARETVDMVLHRQLPHYTIVAELAPVASGGRVRGTLEVEWTNRTGERQWSLPFRLFANDPEPVVTIDDVTVDGRAVDPQRSVADSVATLPLPDAVDNGVSVTIAMRFQTIVPLGGEIHYGMLGIDPVDETWSLAHWYPIVAIWDDGAWMLDPPSRNGDPVVSETGTYDVTFTAPADLVIVGTGTEVEGSVDGATQVRRYVSGPTRDAVYAADDAYEVTEIAVGQTMVRSFYLPEEAVNGAAIADYAAGALTFFEDLLGPYPYTELDLASVDVSGALGVEYPAFIAMSRAYYTNDDIDLAQPNAMEFTTVHEVAHQWFYALVGNNQYDHAFIDEGLANQLSGDLYMRETYGAEIGSSYADLFIGDRYRQGIGSDEDLRPVDMPTDDFPSTGAYVYAMYYKGAWGFHAIEQEIGAAAYRDGLRRYVAQYSWLIATPDDLLAAFETASGEELDALWTYWFESDDGTTEGAPG